MLLSLKRWFLQRCSEDLDHEQAVFPIDSEYFSIDLPLRFGSDCNLLGLGLGLEFNKSNSACVVQIVSCSIPSQFAMCDFKILSGTANVIFAHGFSENALLYMYSTTIHCQFFLGHTQICTGYLFFARRTRTCTHIV